VGFTRNFPTENVTQEQSLLGVAEMQRFVLFFCCFFLGGGANAPSPSPHSAATVLTSLDAVGLTVN
jgi:hypothetical protein